MIVPEITLYNYLKILLKELETQATKVPKEESLLYEWYKDISFEGESYYDMAKELFTRGNTDHPKKVNVSLLFNAEIAKLPTIHINMPSENTSQVNGVGISAGYLPNFSLAEEKFAPVVNRAFDASYNFIITSDNITEVTILYSGIRALMIATLDHLNLEGIQNPKLSGGDLTLVQEIVPEGIFMRALGIDFMYDVSTPQLKSFSCPELLSITSKIINNGNQ